MIRTALGDHFRVALVAIAMLAATLVALAGPKPAETALSEKSNVALPSKHAPMAFEDDGDIWMVRNKVHLANVTPEKAAYNDLDPAVSPEGRRIAFASDRDGDFEIYLVNVSTGEVQRLTDNAVADRKPAWAPGGRWISYQSLHYSSPTHSGIFSVKVPQISWRLHGPVPTVEGAN